MKRLALLAITAFIAAILFACGGSSEKKVDNSVKAPQQSQESLDDAAKGAVQPSTGTDTTNQPSNPSGQ